MFEISRLVVFILASIGLLLIPGPAVLFIIARSMHQGRKAGVVSVFGLEVGSLMQVAAAAAGITAIVLSSALAFNIVKYLGAAYLIYMGIRKLRERDQDIRAIVSSGYSTDPVMAQCLEHGFDAVLPKPYQVGELIRVVEQLSAA